MKKKVIIISVVIILVVLLFPIRNQLKDGGSQYKSLTYEITKVHSLMPEEEAEKTRKVKPYNDGYVIKILGFEIYNNVE